jgi:hypothetical protein
MMPLQQVLYGQMMYLVLIHSCVTALTSGRLRRQKLKRTGEVGAPQGTHTGHSASTGRCCPVTATTETLRPSRSGGHRPAGCSASPTATA